MKLMVGDTVLITAGKDRGKKGEIIRVIPKKRLVVVAGINLYTRHVKPYAGRSGEKTTRERPLPLSKVAIINEKGQPDRVGYVVTKDGKKQRVFRKTGTVIAVKPAASKGKKAAKK
ncbi:MAG: 50S ribosomal protein L24 [Candidatus Pacebacteria bacterium GW2011_GWB1_47_8]|nr:MAG: 50S ribosomal protein L24 [Candidatus Pacebacteria bacterium GW2011_GWA1_46_10]KKU84130.1 MAG: 50S ribosomal protein L24 [Candidatus Pacebacteria bacterium GW2011_GWB1_47_8]HCR80913.1 50S ribosomal protein L24 [Candidatus Paceibacterota bacterium]